MFIYNNMIKSKLVQAWGYYTIIIFFIFVTSSFTINYASAEIDISLTPDDRINNKHSLIIDIDDPDASGTIQVNITVISQTQPPEPNPDHEEIDVNFDPSWGKYRLVISTNILAINPGDGIIQAEHNDIIQVEYGADPSNWKSVIFNTPNALEPTGNRWTFSTIIGCPVDSDGDPDTDKDGVCDVWEDNANGLVIEDLDGVDPQIPGTYIYDCSFPDGTRCGSDKPDIFVEIDWIQSHKPDPKAIQQFIDAFANARDSNNELDGIRLHIQVDPLSAFPHLKRINFPGYDIDGYRGFDQLKADSFGTTDEQNNPNTDWDEVKKLKHQVFHYGLFAHERLGDKFQTGVGEIVGNDLLITLGKYTGKIGSTDQQAGTLMHELGHNLGLNHGGGEFDVVNDKPNLYSVMTYARQFADLDSNRKLDFSNATLGHHHTSAPVWGLHEESIKGYSKGLWPYPGHVTEPIIFSCPDGQVAPMIYLTGRQGGVDWDCDGDPTTRGKFPLNINNLPTEPNSDLVRLDGHNDWNALNFVFSDNIGNYADGRHSKVASGATQSGGKGIPFGETEKTLAAKGLKPDTGYNFVPTGTEELTFEKVARHRISHLLLVHRQLDIKFDENDFSSGFPLGSNASLLSTNSMILQTQFQSTAELKKDSFKKAVVNAIKLINIHDIQNTQKAVQLIDAALEKSLSNSNYKKIQPTMSNIIGAYDQIVGFGNVSMEEPLLEPIVDPGEIENMIKDVEKFVDDIEQRTEILCGEPFVIEANECVCPPGTQEDEEADCVKESKLMVLIETSLGNAGEAMEITVTFTDIDGNPVEHVNYNIMATQGTEIILDDTGVHDLDGVMTHTTMVLTMAASDEMPVDVSVEFLGFGIDEPFTGPIGHMETAQVVPEFGTIAMMILGVGIVSIIAISAKSRVIPRL